MYQPVVDWQSPRGRQPSWVRPGKLVMKNWEGFEVGTVQDMMVERRALLYSLMWKVVVHDWSVIGGFSERLGCCGRQERRNVRYGHREIRGGFRRACASKDIVTFCTVSRSLVTLFKFPKAIEAWMAVRIEMPIRVQRFQPTAAQIAEMRVALETIHVIAPVGFLTWNPT